MRKYAKISPLFWTHGSGRRLRGDSDGQLLALHLVTGPSATMIGLYYLPLPTIAHELGWELDRVSITLRRVCSAGFAAYDASCDLVWVFNSVAFEFGDGKKIGPRTARGIANKLEPFGNHPFVRDFLHIYGKRYRIIVPGLEAAPLDPTQMALPYPSDTPSRFGHQDQVLPGITRVDQGSAAAQKQLPPPKSPETMADAQALLVTDAEARELYEHWQDEHADEHHSSKNLMPSKALIDQAIPVLVNAGRDMALAKAAVSAMVRASAEDEPFWHRKRHALSLLANPDDFERARIMRSKMRPRSFAEIADETWRETQLRMAQEEREAQERQERGAP